MLLTRASLTVLLTSVVLVAPASAQNCVAPPGTSAVDEYCENVPDARGEQGGKGGGSGGSGQVPPGTLGALAASGPNGEALVRSLGKDPAAVKKPKRSQRGGAPGATARPPEVPSSNPLNAVSQALGKGATIGSGFVFAGLALLLAMLVWAWTAYRRSA